MWKWSMSVDPNVRSFPGPHTWPLVSSGVTQILCAPAPFQGLLCTGRLGESGSICWSVTISVPPCLPRLSHPLSTLEKDGSLGCIAL